MERKSWSWKKRVLEKLASPRASSDPYQAEEFSYQNDDDPLKAKNAFKEDLSMLDGLSQAEVKLRILSEQLMARDELAQQHAKVAEEAVAGWEKAEYEAACLKQQLDEEMLSKSAVEEQLVRLRKNSEDTRGQLNNTEQSELRLKQLLEVKAQEIEGLRNEMQLTMSKVVSEMARSKKEADARSQAEDKANLLQTRVDMVEREQANLKYELHVLAKELDIRDEELERNKQVAENATRERLENVRVAAKLEDDCHRLRSLLHKQIPGPSSNILMRIEGEAFCPTVLDRPNHALRPSARFGDLSVESALSDALQELETRIISVEDEKNLLKEALAKKDKELHSARLLCAKMATKISAAEEQFEKVMPPRVHATFHRSTKSAIDGYTSSLLLEQSILMGLEDENMEIDNNSAESWASALLTELAQIKRDKLTISATTSFGLLGNNLMDDFVEIEKLARTSKEKDVRQEPENSWQLKQANCLDGTRLADGSIQPPQKNSSQEVKSKLVVLENELNAVKVENLTTKAALSSIEKHLVTILQAETEERASTIDVFDEIRSALDSMYKNLTDWNGPHYNFSSGADSPEARDATAWSPMGQSSCQSEDVKFSPKKANTGQKLGNAVHKVVVLFEELAQVDWKQGHSLDSNDVLARIHIEKLWRTSEFDSCIRSLILLCNGVLDEKVDVNDFLEEIASALEWLVNHVYASSEKRSSAQRRLEFGRRSHVSFDKQSLPEDPCAINNDSTSIEKQLIQLKNEKEDIDIKLNAMTKELEHLKAVLQNSEGNMPDGDARQPLTALGYRDENIWTMGMCGDIKSEKLENYQLQTLVENSKALSNGLSSVSLQRARKTISTTMDFHYENTSIPVQEGTIQADQDQELGGCGEKLAECQQAIVLLGKQLQALGVEGHASEPLSKSDHISSKVGKAHRRAQRSFEQLHTIHEDSSTYEETKIVPYNGEMGASNYALASPEIQKDFSNESTRDLNSERSSEKLGKTKTDSKQDSIAEKHVKVLSRFFSKSKLFNDGTP